MKKTLLILAGGMGARYGGLKQIDGFGPNNESILEYSIYDAYYAGFTEVVIVLRRDFLDKFEKKFVHTFQNIITTHYVFQETDVTRFGGNDGSHRQKPWGTAHAILSAKDIINGPFAVINADDYYGKTSFARMAAALEQVTPKQSCMIGYVLENTLSSYGSVNRGVCRLSHNGLLLGVQEYHAIIKNAENIIECKEGVILDPKTIVSMNFWGFDASFMEIIENDFTKFLQEKGSDPIAECYIPFVVDNAICHRGHTCNVVTCDASWMGVTNSEDKQEVQTKLLKLYNQGIYPKYLWG